MNKNRLEAFSDGVLAIIITIMVLELKVPHDPSWSALSGMVPILVSYLLSFIYVGIYWNNHHHLFQAVHKVNGTVLWANLHLLFWLSLIPFATAWMGENNFEGPPAALYGMLLLMAALAFNWLSRSLLRIEGRESILAKAMGQRTKEKASTVLYIIGVLLALKWAYVSLALYFVVAAIWLVPDRRIESKLG